MPPPDDRHALLSDGFVSPRVNARTAQTAVARSIPTSLEQRVARDTCSRPRATGEWVT